MDRVLFGDNQFFGVNHMSEEKARAQAMRFSENSAVLKVLDDAFDMGLRTFMCTTHDRIAEIAEYMRAQPERYSSYLYYPCMPYAHKYANAVGELGMLGALREYAPGGLVETVFKGARSALRKDAERLMQILVDAEMKPFAGLNAPVIFLQNVVTDLLLGLGMHDILGAFDAHVRGAYGAEAGFITMNLPMLLDSLDRAGVSNPIVCCNYNKIGFRMSGGVDVYDRTIAEREVRCIAMSVFASGAITADEAIRWICERPKITSVVFGASSAGNIRHTIDLVNRYSVDVTATS